jgi:hypothetical protein
MKAKPFQGQRAGGGVIAILGRTFAVFPAIDHPAPRFIMQGGAFAVPALFDVSVEVRDLALVLGHAQ